VNGLESAHSNLSVWGARMSSIGSAQGAVAKHPAATSETKATATLRHSAFVRVTHWITFLCFAALLVSGIEIVISHPRFYWGETGNVNTKALFQIPIPSSRHLVQTGYGYTLPDQNGWSRSLHFEAAWGLVLTGLLYTIGGVASSHFRKNLLPAKRALTFRAIGTVMIHHLRFERPDDAEAYSYNVLQRLTYVLVIFVVFPLMILSGLALSPAFNSGVPWVVGAFGGRQSARTIHFFLTMALTVFLLIHVFMVWRAGFWSRIRAMITGRTATSPEAK